MKIEHIEAIEVAKAALQGVMDTKGEDAALFKVGEFVGYTDYILVATGRSNRQLKSMADEVEKRVTALGEKVVGIEGKDHGGWVLIDFGTIVVHLFQEDIREYYQLDKLWSNFVVPIEPLIS
jgi:ribosome-associated protein